MDLIFLWRRHLAGLGRLKATTTITLINSIIAAGNTQFIPDWWLSVYPDYAEFINQPFLL